MGSLGLFPSANNNKKNKYLRLIAHLHTVDAGGPVEELMRDVGGTGLQDLCRIFRPQTGHLLLARAAAS